MSTEEKAYMAESLDFITFENYKDNHKDFFSPLLTSIASNMNENPELITAMNIIKTKHDSNLKDLIVKLSEKELIKGKYIQIEHANDYAKYVQQCLRIIGVERSKKSIYELFYLVMQDLNLPENIALMEKVNSFKKNNEDWKKMVGMLIPPGASVKILVDLVEPTTISLMFGNTKWRPLTSREVIGTVVRRVKVHTKHGDGARINQITKRFKKVVRLPEEIIQKANVNEEVILNPEHIELYDSQPESGEGEGAGEAAALGASAPTTPTASAVSVDDAAVLAAVVSAAAIPVEKPEQQSPAIPVETPEQANLQKKEEGAKGGQQRTTRKHKNSIIGSAKKSRTNR
jgi:hypothetical protein